MRIGTGHLIRIKPVSFRLRLGCYLVICARPVFQDVIARIAADERAKQPSSASIFHHVVLLVEHQKELSQLATKSSPVAFFCVGGQEISQV